MKKNKYTPYSIDNNIGEKLITYGLLSMAIVGVSDVNGQVIYTDVDPDFTGGIGDSFAIDFNNDGVDDVFIEGVSGAGYQLTYMSGFDENDNILIDPNGLGFPQPIKLSAGEPIYEGVGPFNAFGVFCATSTNAGPWCSGTEGFAGLRFDIGSELHYGWVLLRATTNVFSINGYAYEATPNTLITAGAGLGSDGVSKEEFTYLVDRNNKLQIISSTPVDQLLIVNVLGQIVHDQKGVGKYLTIDLNNLGSGTYIGKASVGKKVRNFKILVR